MAFDQNWYNKINGSKIRVIRPKLELKTKENAGADNRRYRFPSQKTSLQHIAQALLNTSVEEVATYGFDDTKKAPEVRLHYVKTGHAKNLALRKACCIPLKIKPGP